VETLLYQTARRLAEPPLVLAPAPASAPDLPVRSVGIQWPTRLTYRPLWALHPSLHYLQRFWRPAFDAVATWHPRVIQAGHVYFAPLASVLARRFALPYVVYAYGQEVWRGGRRMGQAALDSKLRGTALRSAERVLVTGSFTAGLLSYWGVQTSKVVAVPYGADPRPDSRRPPTGSTLLSVARLVPRKGVDTVIRALPALPAEVEYRVVGSGPDEGRLHQLAHSLGVEERVHFLGRLDDRALAEEYQRCTLFVLPSRRTADGDLEGYGLVYFEAAAWGRPVVAGRSGGEVDAVVDGETGILVDGESVLEVAQTIGDLLANPQRLCSLAAAGRARVENSHNWTRAAAVIDSTLESLA
jgi:phosphatidylinositol alpha-1,6-mannosyltransferase